MKMSIKRNLFLLTVMTAFCCGLSGCAAGERIPMAGVPYCDSEIRNGSFRSGVTLRAAGREAADAVCIDSYGSLVYDLGGMADSFSAEAGIDGEACRDEVRLDIIVDRKLKESIRFTREAPRRRISVPLTGARQLELSVQYGPDYRAQTLCFADAYFRVRDRAAFLEHLVRCRNRADMARELPPGPLPPLPAWKEVKVEPFVWRERPALRIGNGVLEYEIVPSFGGRLVGFRRAGGENVLEQPRHPLPADLRRGRSYYRQHTRFARSEPAWYFLPGEDLHLFGPYELRFGEEGECILTSRPSLFLLLRTEYRFRLRPGGDRLEVTTILHNLGDFSRPCGIWSVAVLPTESIDKLELPGSTRNSDAPAEAAQYWINDGNSAFLRVADIPFDRLESVERKSPGPRQTIRAHLVSGDVLAVEATPEEHGAEFPNHVYAARQFTELEHHSAIAELPSGGRITLRELWTLRTKGDDNAKEKSDRRQTYFNRSGREE
ncbi:MAG: hypothetical protein HP002_11400 [Lentisphaeria bacterium]|nr:hypothetical protein [Lentisphaeria bacterium]